MLPTAYKKILLPVIAATAFVASCSVLHSVEPGTLFNPVYRIPLRVHLGNSGRPAEQWRPILEEINTIWLSQAGICFEIETVDDDEKMTAGLDLWFDAAIPDWNGYFNDRHDIHVRDDPDLRPARNPALSSAARTAAHELGHALELHHLQDSDDNLMRSKTYGWRLNPDEIKIARENTGKLGAAETDGGSCIILIHNNP